MLIYGASGHGKVIASCLKKSSIDIEGFFDDGVTFDEFLSYPIFGGYDASIKPHMELVIGIGDNKTRKFLAGKCKHTFGKVIAQSAMVDDSAVIGEGSVIFHNSIIQIDSKIGMHCIINTGSSIDHDCKIGDFVHISPQSTICGTVEIGDSTHVGANATIIPNLKIGSNSIIGAGSVVINDIPDNVTVVGNPAKIIKRNE